MVARLTDLEVELDEIESTTATMEAEAKAPPAAPHPHVAEGYRQKISELHTLLTASAVCDDAAPATA